MIAGGAQPLLRPGAPTDLEQVARLERASFDDPWSLAALDAELRPDGLRRPLVAELDGRVAGYIMAWAVADQLHILNIATDPTRRRCGVASALLRQSLALARGEGLREVTLEVRESNTGAQEFYRRHGFAVAGRRRRYYVDNGEDALVMTRELAADGG